MPDAVRIVNVRKVYAVGARTVVALGGVSLMVRRGEFLALVGPSGSGKSTLLNLIAGLDVATSGEIEIDGVTLSGLDDDALTDLRRTRIGVVFQFFNLVPSITALENVALPLRASRIPRMEASARARAALAAVGLEDRRDHLPDQLSGGEMQRVAIARALVIAPTIILADEPTGNLDSATGEEVLATLRRVSRDGTTVVLVTHNLAAAASADRLVTLRDGVISE